LPACDLAGIVAGMGQLPRQPRETTMKAKTVAQAQREDRKRRLAADERAYALVMGKITARRLPRDLLDRGDITQRQFDGWRAHSARLRQREARMFARSGTL
jgi:hypothetical protein